MIHAIFQKLRFPKQGISRRTFLNFSWIAALGLTAIQAARMGLDTLRPPVKPGQFGGLFDIGALADLPLAQDPPANYPEGKFWLVRQGSQLRAFYKRCTHLDCLFSWSNQENAFICPCHGSRFDRTGSVLSGPAPRALDEFVIQIVLPDGRLFAETDAATGLSLPAMAAAAGQDDANDRPPAPSEASGEAIPAAALVRVDTGRKIPNITAAAS